MVYFPVIMISAAVMQSIIQTQSENSLSDVNATTNYNYTNENSTSPYDDNSSRNANVTVEVTFFDVTELENVTNKYSENNNATNESYTVNVNSENMTVEVTFSDVTELENATNKYSENNNVTNESYTVSINSENATSTDFDFMKSEQVINKTEENINSTFSPDENNVANNKCPDNIDANHYVDNLLAKISENASDEIRLLPRRGFFTLTNGKIIGLLSMKRFADAKVTCNSTMTTIQALFRFKDLVTVYNWEKKIPFKTLKGRVFLSAEEVDIFFGVSQVGSKASLDTFKIMNMSGIKTDVTGLSYLTWATSRLTNPVIKNFRRTMSKIIEGPLKDAFTLHIRQMDFPHV